MLKRFNVTSPVGIALTAAGIILALSPGARKAVRGFMVKGTAGVMDAMEQMSGGTSGFVNPKTAVTWTSNETGLSNEVVQSSKVGQFNEVGQSIVPDQPTITAEVLSPMAEPD